MMRDMGIKPELECFNPSSIEDVFNVLEPAGVLDDPVSLSFVMGMGESARAQSLSQSKTLTL